MWPRRTRRVAPQVVPQVLFARGQTYEQMGELSCAKEDFESWPALCRPYVEVMEKLRGLREKLGAGGK